MSESGEGPKIIAPEVPFAEAVKDKTPKVTGQEADMKQAVADATVLGQRADQGSGFETITKFADKGLMSPPLIDDLPAKPVKDDTKTG